jgi:replicative DNA helicase
VQQPKLLDRPWRAIDVAGRVPPNNPEAEAACIADGIANPHGIDAITLQPEHFYGESHRRVWRALRAMREHGKHIDIVTLHAWLAERGEIDGLGNDEHRGLAWLAWITDTTPSIAHLQQHADIVIEYARRRAIIATAQVIAGEGMVVVRDEKGRSPLSTEELADLAEREIGEACGGVERHGASMEFIGDIAARRRIELADQWSGKREAWGMRGPIDSLNRLTHGHIVGSFTIVAGLTSSGKTCIAAQTAAYCAGKSYVFSLPDGTSEIADVGVLFISMEMSSRAIVDRHINAAATINSYSLMSGRDADGRPLDPMTLANIDGAISMAGSLPILVEPGGKDLNGVRRAIRIAQAKLRAWARRTGRKCRLGLVVVDHIHLMDENDERDVANALGRVAKGLKRIAVDEALHMIGLGQLNREGIIKRGPEGRPMIYDLKNSSALEQAADQIHLVHRAFLLQNDKESPEAQRIKNRAEIIVAKARDGGELGSVRLEFEGQFFRFSEAA